MASLNKVMIIGNVTRDPETRYTPKGAAVCDLGIAVNRHYTTDAGEKREETTFVDVVFFGRQAEVAGQYLKKGAPVFVEGRLQLDTWDDRETGQKRTRLKIIGENMQMLGGKAGLTPGVTSEQSTGYGGQRANPAPANRAEGMARHQAPDTSGYDADEENIPF